MDLLERYGCSVADREAVMDFIVGPRKAGRLLTDHSRVADSGIVSVTVSTMSSFEVLLRKFKPMHPFIVTY